MSEHLQPNPKFHIRPMQLSDLDAIMEIEPQSFGTHHWTRENFLRELDNGIATYLVLENVYARGSQNGSIQGASERSAGVDSSINEDAERACNAEVRRTGCLGYIGVWIVIDEMHIVTLAVDPSHRRQGIAEALLLSVLDLALKNNIRGVTLEVRLSNLAAQNLYRKYSFQRQGLRPNYYEDNKEAALLLWTEDLSTEKFRMLYEFNLAEYRTSLIPSTQ
jgi:ribosomal-protein-alanine N-acetyltransferase